MHKKIIATAMEVKRTSLDYFTKDGFLALHEIYLDTSDFVAESLSCLKATGSSGTASTHPPTGRVSQPGDVLDRLFTVRLPQFSEPISEWESFRDCFSAKIIARQSLPNSFLAFVALLIRRG